MASLRLIIITDDKRREVICESVFHRHDDKGSFANRTLLMNSHGIVFLQTNIAEIVDGAIELIGRRESL